MLWASRLNITGEAREASGLVGGALAGGEEAAVGMAKAFTCRGLGSSSWASIYRLLLADCYMVVTHGDESCQYEEPQTGCGPRTSRG